MKIYLGLISAAAWALTACAPEAPQPPAQTAAPAAPAAAASEAVPPSEPVEAASEASAPTVADAADADCRAEVLSNDQMQYGSKEINVKSSCKQFTVVLKHVGTQPKAAMGHNIVITAAADKQAVLDDGIAAGLDNDYVKADDARVLAHTKMIGGGEETSLTLDVAKLNKDSAYEFFCTFPGHAAAMTGKVQLVD